MFNQTEETTAEVASESNITPAKSSVLKKVATTLGVLLLLGAVGAAGYFYKQYDTLKKNPNKAAVDESKAVIAAVGKLYVLPTGEEPTIATVTDPSQLQDQAFFIKAKTGDKVLIYTNAKKAILYSPTENKIVEVAPINIGTAAAPNDSAVGGANTTTPAAATDTNTNTNQ